MTPVEKKLRSLIPVLCLPYPSGLDRILGYEGSLRLCAFYWEPAGDTLACSDGMDLLVGANWEAWLIYCQHQKVTPFLASYDLGSSDTVATHWLVLDRVLSNAYIGTQEQVRETLTAQRPKIVKHTASKLDTADIDHLHQLLVQEMARPIDLAEEERTHKRYMKACGDLGAWLEKA